MIKLQLQKLKSSLTAYLVANPRGIGGVGRGKWWDRKGEVHNCFPQGSQGFTSSYVRIKKYISILLGYEVFSQKFLASCVRY